ncbi:MAG: AAA family ATPase [Actinobacteria bacterium]|nr:AAA family ATPase [Actinomycetota bacterium]
MTDSLFSSSGPLAARIRPRTLEEVVGQQKALAQGSPLSMLAKKPVGSSAISTSVVIWGPPGTGKTTIAKAVANTSGRRFVELSAVSTGVKELREVIDKARVDQELYSVATIVFLDEIHRFSKAQQDALLPAVEAGWIVLIAATTENPSFSVNAPLLSRSLVVKLEPLAESDIADLIQRAIQDPAGLAGKVTVSKDAVNRICQIAGGDARRALTVLEAAASRAIEFSSTGQAEISLEDVLAALETALVRYDREGEQHYDTISAFIKSVRGSDPDAALHYLARMLEGGEDPRFIARRLMILASEDIGLADSQALPLTVAAFDTVANIGMPEARIALAQATIYLALAPKSNSAYLAINAALEDVRAGFTPPIPLYLRSASSARVGSDQSYVYPHDQPNAVATQDYLAESRQYYTPKHLGQEKPLAERLDALRAIIRGKKA